MAHEWLFASLTTNKRSDLPASGIEQVGHGRRKGTDGEAKKQRRKREKAAAKYAALGVEKFTVEVAGVFKPDLKRVMATHGINNQQEVCQLLLINMIAADFDTQTRCFAVSRHLMSQVKRCRVYFEINAWTS